MKAAGATISFGVLLILAIALTGTAYYLNLKDFNPPRTGILTTVENIQNDDVATQTNANTSATTNIPSEAGTVAANSIVSTIGWQEYVDKNYYLSFKYPPAWSIKTYQRDTFDIIVLEPDQGQAHIRIYISSTEYIGMDGLKTSPISVGGVKGISAGDMVVGVKRGPNFYTFDAGVDQSLLPQFNGMLESVTFSR